MKKVLALLHRLFVESWQILDAGSGPGVSHGGAAATLEQIRRRGYDWSPFAILVMVAVSLTLFEYYGDRGDFIRLFPEYKRGTDLPFFSYAWTTGMRVLAYVLLPAAMFLLLSRRHRPASYYLSLRSLPRYLPHYAGVYLGAVLALVLLPHGDNAYPTYPFHEWQYRAALGPWTWHGLYALQVVAVEFFFRGFMLSGLERRLGSSAIFVMVVPYCMIQFSPMFEKPLAEAITAIAVAILLGILAMRSRSIWGGVLFHLAVAWTMELL